jgi:hypothetical protein
MVHKLVAGLCLTWFPAGDLTQADRYPKYTPRWRVTPPNAQARHGTAREIASSQCPMNMVQAGIRTLRGWLSYPALCPAQQP